MRVLVAEDERITRMSLQRHLEAWGHEVTVSEDGAAAWDVFQSGEFDAVLTDWQMPRMDGLELVRRIRAADVPRFVYVVLLTSRSETDDLIAGLDAGANDFLKKPFDRGELRARLNAGQRIIDLERALAQQNDRMRRDLQAAADYVRSLLPPPLRSPVRIDWLYAPAGDLAGDTLGYHAIDSDHLALYLLDVTGHGLDAALLSVAVLNVVRSMTLPDVDFRRPAQVLSRLNERFPMEAHQDRSFTIWYGVYRPADRMLRWSGAGHPAALAYAEQGGAPRPLPSTGPMCGMLPDWDGTDAETTLRPGSRLYLFSDGVYEIERRDGTLWPFDEFQALLALPVPGGDGAPRLRELLRHVEQLRNGAALDDDFTILELCVP